MNKTEQDKAIKLYKEGLTVYEIGAELGVSYVTIWNILKSNNVEMRARGVTKGTKFVKEDGGFIPSKRFPDGKNKPKDVQIFEANAKINIPEGFAVVHLNGKKTDCNLTNLALVTMEYYKQFMGEYPSYYNPSKNEPKKATKTPKGTKVNKNTKKNKK